MINLQTLGGLGYFWEFTNIYNKFWKFLTQLHCQHNATPIIGKEASTDDTSGIFFDTTLYRSLVRKLQHLNPNHT